MPPHAPQVSSCFSPFLICVFLPLFGCQSMFSFMAGQSEPLVSFPSPTVNNPGQGEGERNIEAEILPVVEATRIRALIWRHKLFTWVRQLLVE